jgi:asparagine synthase (glutamine-hydrolysing)
VILTGEGADEILLGYNIFKETIIRKFWSKFPDSKLRPLLLKKLYSYLPQYSNNRYSNLIYEFYKNTLNVDTFSYGHLVRWGNNTKNKIYYSDDMKNHIQNYNAIDDFRSQMPKRFFDASIIDQTQYIEVQTLLKGYLLSSQADRMLMANSVEGRFPYLDHNFIEFASKLPQNMKLKGMKDKYILRKSYDQHLPSQILNREKIAYQAPDIRGFIQNGKISDIVQENLNTEKINSLGFFNQKKISSLINRVSNSNSERTSTRDNQAFVQMLSTQLVKKIFIDEFEKNLKNRSVNINMKVIKSH